MREISKNFCMLEGYNISLQNAGDLTGLNIEKISVCTTRWKAYFKVIVVFFMGSIGIFRAL